MTKRTDITILLADNDNDIRDAMVQGLRNQGYHVIEANNARAALELARHNRPDVLLLDLGLPDMSGFELCARMRALPFVNDVPILFLGTENDAEHVAQALDCGGDDYIRKPFAMSELIARIRALIRRSISRRFPILTTLHLEVDNYSVVVNKRRIALTPTEFSLLDFLCADPSQHHTANSLLETLWQYPPGGGDTALVRNHIRNLRRKIEEDPDHPRIIISLHGRGYTVNARVVHTA